MSEGRGKRPGPASDRNRKAAADRLFPARDKEREVKPAGFGPKQGQRTGTTCPVCGDAVLQQEKYGRAGAIEGHRLVCSRRGCPWQSQVA